MLYNCDDEGACIQTARWRDVLMLVNLAHRLRVLLLNNMVCKTRYKGCILQWIQPCT